MNLQQLRYLVSAADTGSFSGAARREYVSQPVLSRALRGLERELGVEVFRREGRRVVVTDSGTTVVAAARRVLDAVDELHATAAREAEQRGLVVTATPTNSTLFAPILSGFMDRHPHVRMRLSRAPDTAAVHAMVADRAADLGFCDVEADEQEQPDGLRHDPLWRAEVVLVSPATSGFPPVVPRARLAELPLVLPTPESGRRGMIEGLVTDAGGRTPLPVLATDERTAWVTSAQHGIGSFVTYRATASTLEQVTVSALDPPLDVMIGFVHRRDGLTAEGRAVIELARTLAPPPGCHAL
jgi:DNA-binding transcriptional LysR family regulator